MNTQSPSEPKTDKPIELAGLEPETLDALGLQNAAMRLVNRTFDIFGELSTNLLKVEQHALLAQLVALHKAVLPIVRAPIDEPLKGHQKSEILPDGAGTPIETMRRLNEYAPMFNDHFLRFQFAANANYFELYVSDVLIVLNYLFPRVLLDKEALDKGSVPGRLLLEGGSILDARLRFIESRVMSQVFSESLPAVLKKLAAKLKYPFEFDTLSEKTLTKIAAIRNILTHNRGIANATFAARLKRAGISLDFKLGQVLPLTDEDKVKAAEFLRSVAGAIVAAIVKSIPEMSHHEVALR
jgi:hypothetical protein